MKKLRFALIGAGRMGARWAHVLSKNPNVSLVTIADTGSGKASELSSQIPGCRATRYDLRAINNNEVDAVIIATPHKDLAPITSDALKAGKHVLCEKPGAIKSNDIRKNITLANRMGLTYMVGYNHRFHDGFIKARRLYQKRAIGKIILIRARYGFGGRVGYDKEWRLDKATSGGGHLIDQGVHMVDLAMSFMGEIQKVRGFTSDTFWKRGVEDNAFVLLRGKNTTTASIHVSLTQWKPLHNFEIYGTKGYLSIEGLGQKYGGSEKLIIGKRADDFVSGVKEKVIVCNSVADNSLTLELAEFVSAVRQGRQVAPFPTKAYETLKIVEKIYRANKL